jgi:hypothetical protein
VLVPLGNNFSTMILLLSRILWNSGVDTIPYPGLEGTTDGVVRYRDAGLLVELQDQTAGLLPHHAMDLPSLMPRTGRFLPGTAKERPIPAERPAMDVDEAVQITQISQRLPVHPADLGRLGLRSSIEHRSNPATGALRHIFRLLHMPANLAGCTVTPHRNSLAHGNPLGCHLESRYC